MDSSRTRTVVAGAGEGTGGDGAGVGAAGVADGAADGGRGGGGGDGRREGLRRQPVDPGRHQLRPRSEPDPVPETPLRVDQEGVGCVGHGVAGRGIRLHPGVRDAPRAGCGPDLVVGAGEPDVSRLVVVHVLLHGRCVVAGGIDRDEDDADLPVDQLAGVADVGQVRRADVGAVGVPEEDEDRAAAHRGQVERPAVLVGQPQGRRGGERSNGRVAREPLGRRRDRPDRGPRGRRGRRGRRHGEPGHRPDRDPGERGEAEGKRGQQGEAGRGHGPGRGSHDRPVALRRSAVGHRVRDLSSPAPRR